MLEPRDICACTNQVAVLQAQQRSGIKSLLTKDVLIGGVIREPVDEGPAVPALSNQRLHLCDFRGKLEFLLRRRPIKCTSDLIPCRCDIASECDGSSARDAGRDQPSAR